VGELVENYFHYHYIVGMSLVVVYFGGEEQKRGVVDLEQKLMCKRIGQKMEVLPYSYYSSN